MIRDDLLQVADKIRRNDQVLRNMNSTFIALILKVDHPKGFGDFRPVACVT